MKTLLLLRHAKSSWDDPTIHDFDRPLNKRGKKAAPLMGKLMRSRKLKPDLVISSPAERARDTAGRVIRAAGLKTHVHLDERLYETTADRLMEIISEEGNDAGEMMLVGHNPAMEELLERLTGEVHHMPTASMARIVLDVGDWKEVRDRTGRLDWLVKPKDLNNS